MCVHSPNFFQMFSCAVLVDLLITCFSDRTKYECTRKLLKWEWVRSPDGWDWSICIKKLKGNSSPLKISVQNRE